MDRRIFLAGIAGLLTGQVRLQTDASTPAAVASPHPVIIASRHGVLREGTVVAVPVTCHLAVYDSIENAKTATDLTPDFEIDLETEISVIGPEPVDLPKGLEDVYGRAWRVRTYEGAAAAETTCDWIIFRVDRAVWTFEIITRPHEAAPDVYGLEEVVPGIAATWDRAPDPTPASLTQEMLDDMLPGDDDFAGMLEWMECA